MSTPQYNLWRTWSRNLGWVQSHRSLLGTFLTLSQFVEAIAEEPDVFVLVGCVLSLQSLTSAYVSVSASHMPVSQDNCKFRLI